MNHVYGTGQSQNALGPIPIIYKELVRVHFKTLTCIFCSFTLKLAEYPVLK